MKIVAIVGRREEYLQYEILKGLYKRNIEIITSEPLNNIVSKMSKFNISHPPINQPVYTDDEIIEHAKDADYIFVFWNKHEKPQGGSVGGKMYLVDRINIPEKTVIIDGSEWSSSGFAYPHQPWKDFNNYEKGTPWIWYYMRDRSKWYFKRETFPEDVHEHKIIPLSYPCRLEDRRDISDNITSKEYDMLCLFGHKSTGLRSEVMNKSNELKRTHTNNKFYIADSLPREKYLDISSNSKMVVDAWGGGSNCTVRRNEIIMNSTVIIGQKWEIINPYDYVEGEHIINWKTIKEFEEKVDYYINKPELLIQMGKNAYQHALKYHTTEKRIEYIFDIIDGKIEWS